MSDKHTALPWKADYRSSTGFGCGYGKSQIIAANGKAVAGVAAVEPEHGPMYRGGSLSEETFETMNANAELIVRAVNSHAKLLAAAKELEDRVMHDLYCNSRAAPIGPKEEELCNCPVKQLREAIREAEA